MLKALDLLGAVCRDYAWRARETAARQATDPAWRGKLERMAAIIEKIVAAPPETLREAIQLVWLYALISGVVDLRAHGCLPGQFLSAISTVP